MYSTPETKYSFSTHVRKTYTYFICFSLDIHLLFRVLFHSFSKVYDSLFCYFTFRKLSLNNNFVVIVRINFYASLLLKHFGISSAYNYFCFSLARTSGVCYSARFSLHMAAGFKICRRKAIISIKRFII